jgi:hypothetical protein
VILGLLVSMAGATTMAADAPVAAAAPAAQASPTSLLNPLHPARFVEPFGSGVTVGLAIPCPQPPQRIVATVRWPNGAPRKIAGNFCSTNPRENGENEAFTRGGLRVELTTNPEADGRPPEAYPAGPRFVIEATPRRHLAKWVISFRLTEGGTYLDSGTIFMRATEYVSARRVWQGEGLFATVCIGQHKRLTRINHRLGCYLPPEIFTTQHVRWNHR